MKIIRNLIGKIRAYRDRRFLARLERVLNGNVLQSNIVIGGSLLSSGELVAYLKDSELEEIRRGVPVNELLERLRKEAAAKWEPIKKD